MEKVQFCRICRTVDNLKYTTKELRQLNKEQLLLAQANNRASKKLLLTTPTLGNICQICDERIQIFHRLDDGGHESSSDIEVDVVSPVNLTSKSFVDVLPKGDGAQLAQRPETPVIVDDDVMLFNIFMQKFDQKSQLPQHQISTFSHPIQNAHMTNFHSTYTPPQSTGGGSEGDESKIVEILTSRENTPPSILAKTDFTTTKKSAGTQHHRIVAIIDLDDGDEENQNDLITTNIQFPQRDPSGGQNDTNRSDSLSPQKSISVGTNQTYNVDDDEEIVFPKVDKQIEKDSNLKKRRHKMYDEKNMRLVACLNLVSSDSETEDTTSTTAQVQQLSNDKLTVSSTTTTKNDLNCKVCNVSFPDSQSLSVHEKIHQGVVCTLCKIGFPQVKRFIHHMRRKHREYNGDTLSEKPRSGQDSCMTIRLRYMQQTTFYECQLCGRIDEVFKEHKQHILETHPNESKSLKDPIIKQLKCPICKIKCGAQYLSLCRHLINSHEYSEYKTHLRELVHVSSFGWNTARQQEVAKTAKIFQFIKRKTFFFECKICCKVVAGYLHHLRHVNEHQKLLGKRNSSEIAKTKNSDKLGKALNNEVCVSKNLRSRESLTKSVSSLNLENKVKKIEKVKVVSTKMQKPEKNCIKVSKFKFKKIEKVKVVSTKIQKPEKNCIKVSKFKFKKETEKKREAEAKNANVKNIKSKNKCKPKEKDKVELRIYEKISQEKKKEPSKKDKNIKKQSLKAKDFGMKPQKKKVKVKASIKQIDLLKYKCKYCSKKCKGFRYYNLHLMRQHEAIEFSKCNKCNKLFASATNLQEHINQCSQLSNASKRKRKISEKVSSDNVFENTQPVAKKVLDKMDVSSVNLVENLLWLKDLLMLKQTPKLSDNNLSLKESPKNALLKFQCCYCLHFFGNDKDLKVHKEVNHLPNSDILLKYKPLKHL